MLRKSIVPRLMAVGAAAMLAGCGGDGSGGGLVSAPPPLPAPTPSPTPIPTPTASPPALALLDPVDTSSPQPVLASQGGPSFRNPVNNTVFPLMTTAVEGNGYGDRSTTELGAVLSLRTNGTTGLTINNPDWGVSDREPEHGAVDFRAIHGGVGVTDGGLSANLDYTRFGHWYGMTNVANTIYYDGGGAWLGGFLTPPGNIPATGSATYAGSVLGQYSLYGRCACLDFGVIRGSVNLSANFANRQVSGVMSNLVVADGTGFNDPLNDILFSASFAQASNRFQGTTRVAGPPGQLTGPGVSSGLVGLGLNAAGTIAGHFFGPSAQEAGAVWTISDGTNRAFGSIGAKQTGP